MKDYHSQTIGRVADDMPATAQRDAMWAPLGGAQMPPLAQVTNWRLGKAEYSEWFVYDWPAYNDLVSKIPDMEYDPGSSPTPETLQMQFFFDAFVNANGNFEAFIDTFGRVPSDENMLPRWKNQWTAGQKPVIYRPYTRSPYDTGHTANSMSTFIYVGLSYQIRDPVTQVLYNYFKYFMASVPILKDVVWV